MATVTRAPVELRTEYTIDPIGLGEPRPRLFWQQPPGQPGWRQTAWEVEAEAEDHLAGNGAQWRSGRVEGEESAQVEWGGSALRSRSAVRWRVRVWGPEGEAGPWSGWARFELGLLAPADWQARWIGGEDVGGARTGVPAPCLRVEFGIDASRPVVRARLHVTALGLHQTWLNGAPVGDAVFAPGWTDYRRRVPVHTWDVTSLLRPGTNCVAAELGDGWYCGHVGWNDRQGYGDRPWYAAQLEVEDGEGRRQVVATGAGWTWFPGAVLANDLLMGEAHDARREPLGWREAGWSGPTRPVEVKPADWGPERRPAEGPPVRRQGERTAIGPPSSGGNGRWIFDFGQNLFGRVRLEASAPAGTTVTLRFGEMLEPDGRLYTANLRSARATDHYTFRGEGLERWEPKFTAHGFRYAELAGLPGGPPGAATLTAVILHSDLEEAGTFTCSDPLINRLQENIVWGLRGNFVEVPTDCPQRDERLGWTGDAQIFLSTAACNRDVARFLAKWQQDLADAQHPDGSIPPVAPCPPRFPLPLGGPAWSDAVVLCAWGLYQHYADRRLLERHYPVLERFVASLDLAAPDGIREHPDRHPWGGFGDWLALDGSGRTEGGTPKDLIGTAYLARSAALLARIARILGRPSEARRWTDLEARAAAAFQDRYVTRQGLVAGGTQTGYVLALAFDLVAPELRPRLVAELVRDLHRRGGRLATGFVGTPLLPGVLSRFGRWAEAAQLLHQRQWPSWLYPVTQGATTIWERWDGWTREKGFQDPGMNSFNHYAYGAVGAWLHTEVAGLGFDDDAPGGRRLRFRPFPLAGLDGARASRRTLYGPAACGWVRTAQGWRIEAEVPPGAAGWLEIAPDAGHPETEPGPPIARAGPGSTIWQLGAGRHDVFVRPSPPR